MMIQTSRLSSTQEKNGSFLLASGRESGHWVLYDKSELIIDGRQNTSAKHLRMQITERLHKCGSDRTRRCLVGSLIC